MRMKKRSLSLLAIRWVSAMMGAALIWYGVALQRSDDILVDKAFEHASSHSVGEPSKAEFGGSMLETFSNIFGWFFIVVGGAFVGISLLTWSKFVRRPDTEGQPPGRT